MTTWEGTQEGNIKMDVRSGLDSSASGKGQVAGSVNTVMNIWVP
jgi:hypothetical protein